MKKNMKTMNTEIQLKKMKNKTTRADSETVHATA